MTTSRRPRRGHLSPQWACWAAHCPKGLAQAVCTTGHDSGPQPSMLPGQAPLSGGPRSAAPRVCVAPVPRIKYQFDFLGVSDGSRRLAHPMGQGRALILK